MPAWLELLAKFLRGCLGSVGLLWVYPWNPPACHNFCQKTQTLVVVPMYPPVRHLPLANPPSRTSPKGRWCWQTAHGCNRPLRTSPRNERHPAGSNLALRWRFLRGGRCSECECLNLSEVGLGRCRIRAAFGPDENNISRGHDDVEGASEMRHKALSWPADSLHFHADWNCLRLDIILPRLQS